MPTVVLIACCASKLAHAAPARELYDSDLFKKSLAWAEAGITQDPSSAFVLSAMHGLVPLNDVISPYNQTLRSMSAPTRREWAYSTWKQLQPYILHDTHVVFLAGRLYRDDLMALMLADGVPAERMKAPMEGLGIGRQKQWLARSLVSAD